jgi:DNA (cytosine-5)-methyltransferase 1
MAEALGWGMTERPYPTVACSRSTGGPDKEKVGGSGARAQIYAERDAGAWVRFGNQDNSAVRDVSEPAATLRFGERLNACHWVFERPATTVVGSFPPETIAAPGYRVSTADGSRQNAPDSVRVSLEEAALLQSFPSGYPWQGSKTKKFQQVGNAIPPLLALNVLRSVI